MSSGEDIELINQILPFLVTQPNGLSKHEIVLIIKAITKCEDLIIQQQTDDSGTFLCPFVALVSHCIMSYANQIPKSMLSMASSACNVCMKYLLKTISNYDQQSILTKHQLISLIQGLCEDVPPLLKSDIVSLSSQLKTAKIPSSISGQETKSFGSAGTGPGPSDDSAKEPKRIRLDHSCEAILEQLMTPIMDHGNVKRDFEHDKNIISLAQGQGDTKSLLISKNLLNLQQLGGTNFLLDFIMSLSSLQSYIQLVQATEEGAPLKLPNNSNEASTNIKSCKSLIKDYDIVWRILSLPILEPLTEDRLSKVITIVHACLYVSLTLTCSNIIISHENQKSTSPSIGSTVGSGTGQSPSKDDSDEIGVVNEIVDTSLGIYKRCMLVMKNSNRVGGGVCQNVHLFASWLLLSGLKYILKSSGSQLNVPKEQATKKQGYNQLCISLASHVVILLSSLFDDLKSELSLGSLQKSFSSDKLQPSSQHHFSSFKYNKFGYYSAWQRIEMLMSNVNLTSLLFSLASMSYRKAGLLKLVSRAASSDQDFHSTRSNSVKDFDDESCFSSDESSHQDEDSEPILGQLFKEQEEEKETTGTRQILESICQDKREPHKHLTLSQSIFDLLNSYFVCSEIEPLKQYFKMTVNETQLTILGHIIKDLDRESNYNMIFYSDFSRSLTSFMHNLIATEILSEQLQVYLLSQLGVNPDGSSDALWPLNINTRALSILSQIILLKQQKEKDELKSESGIPSLTIWSSLLRHLKKLITDQNELHDLDDINVEHAQLLLFLFHNLKLLQRKSVLFMVSKTIHEVAYVVHSPMKDHQIHFMGRLIHFFEYILKNLYDAPSSLIEQIDNNLFKLQGSKRDKDNNVTLTTTSSKLYFNCKELDDVWQKEISNDNKIFSQTIKPKFYYLLNIDVYNFKEVPKLDGMALNFLLIGLQQEVISYDDLYDSILDLLLVGNQLDLNQRNLNRNSKLGPFGLCAVQYTFNTVWRLILQLPPSVRSFDAFACGDLTKLTLTKAIQSSVWLLRLNQSKWFNIWMKDALVKMLQPDITVKPELYLKNVIQSGSSVTFNVQMLKHLLTEQFSMIKYNSQTDQVSTDGMPSMFNLFALDIIISKFAASIDWQLNLNAIEGAASQPPSPVTINFEVKQAAIELLPTVLNLITLNLSCARWSLIYQMCDEDAEQGIATVPKLLLAYNSVLKTTSIKCNFKSSSSFTSTLSSYLPRNLLKILDKWISLPIDTTPWRTDINSIPTVSESIISSIQSQHFLSQLASNSKVNYLFISLKSFINTLLKFAEELFRLSDNKYPEDFIRVMLPLQLDSTCESFSNYGATYLEATFGPKDSENYLTALYSEALTHSYDLLINYSDKECCVEERILIECLKFMEFLLDSSAGQIALEKFFCEDDSKDIVSLLLSASNDSLSSSYSTRVLKFFSKLFQQADKNPESINLVRLCTSLSKLSKYSQTNSNLILQTWLSKVLCERLEPSQTIVANQENRILLQNLTNYIVKENSCVDEEVAQAFLFALIPMSTQILSSTPEILGFSELMLIMITLAGASPGTGHLELIKSVVQWLDTCKKYLLQKDVLEKLEKNIYSGRHQVIMESTCFMLSYLSDILESLKILSEKPRPASPVTEEGVGVDDTDFDDDVEDEDSPTEESDDESICNKLCTFTTTQKEFMNQHWYHCHTCKMVDGVGVCTICAKVCHKDHDVTYSKYGSFFCDCGAKEDNSCQALIRRSSVPREPIQKAEMPSNLRKRKSLSPSDTSKVQPTNKEGEKVQEIKSKHQMLAKQLEGKKDEIFNLLSEVNVSKTILCLLKYLTPAMIDSCLKNSSIGCSIRAKQALKELYDLEKSIVISDQLMVPTLGSQEGAFENVRMTYTGEQGQQIRQLIASHVIRRVAMCALTGPFGHGKRQHLAVSHEKGKITLLQLGTLLKQADTSKKKLTLTRLASAPLPFTAISICANPCNEDFLAVCGLKDCHVLTFSSTGLVSGHLVLHPQLETGNYIIKSIWLPGEQTQLALVTADFVKIYDLSIDIISPQYYFLLPSGKIRDLTFVFTDEEIVKKQEKHVLIMSSAGHIYCQEMCEQSSAKNGPFYVTNILDVNHEDTTDISSHINGGGISIYYSHTFKLLFFSYQNGKNFAAPMPRVTQELINLFPIEINSSVSSNGASSNGTSSKSITTSNLRQSLCQWTEVSGHPGLILSMCLTTNNPVVIMIKPDSFVVQEIKFLNVKAKITDMVAVRHATANGEMKTTLILLCEDGSLRIYMASQESTNYWLKPTICSSNFLTPISNRNFKRKIKSGKLRTSLPQPTANSGGSNVFQFPVDFFEHCTLMNDIEFGGSDILQIYNVQQIKNRLNTTGMYVANTKPNGFTMEINNNDASMVMVGIRVLLGNQDIQRVPSYIDVFGRQIHVFLTRNRWYDIPFTREESLSADKKISIFFAASSDPNGVTMVDSIKVYGKTKDSFGWPDDANEVADYSNVQPSTSQFSDLEFSQPMLSLSPLDRLLSWSLDVLDGCFSLETIPCEDGIEQRRAAQEVATLLLTLPYQSSVQRNIKSLLFTLHKNKTEYNNHRDEAMVKYVLSKLNQANSNDQLEGELFYRLITISKQIATERPLNLIHYSEFYKNILKETQDQKIQEPKPELKNIELITFDDHRSQITDKSSDSSSEYHSPASQLDLPIVPQRSSSVTFADEVNIRSINSDDDFDSPTRSSSSCSFIIYLTEIFWKLYYLRPVNPLLTSIEKSGLVHVEETVQSLIEIIHSFVMSDISNMSTACQLYLKLLLCEDTAISFGAKQSLAKVLRPKTAKKKAIITPASGTQTEIKEKNLMPQQSARERHHRGQQQRSEDNSLEIFEPQEVGNLMGQDIPVDQQFEMIEALNNDPDVVGGAVGALLVHPDGGFSPLDLGGSDNDVDDEAMVELAIALSLQDQQQQSGGSGAQLLGGPMPSAAVTPQRSASLEDRTHYSDTTASPAQSDDEGSTAATDGSTLRTSPANELHGNEAGSESGGSGAESIIGEASGRSSVYEETLRPQRTNENEDNEDEENDNENDILKSQNTKLHSLRLSLLEKLIDSLDQVRDVGGIRSIPLMQVILMLTSDLDGEGERDKIIINSLLKKLLGELYHDTSDIFVLVKRIPNHEVKLIIMKLLSILMQRARTSTSGQRLPSEVSSTTFCSTITATTLMNSTIIDFCLQTLIHLLEYWKNYQSEPDITSPQVQSSLLKPHLLNQIPEMSPFFVKQFVQTIRSNHTDDVFENYPQLLTEIILRIPYQIKKISNSFNTVTAAAAGGGSSKSQLHITPVTFSQVWCEYLCEYMMINLTQCIRKQVRKLLSYICGSKERYRQLRDFHALESHLKEVKKICRSGGYQDYYLTNSLNNVIVLSYDSTISLIEHLKSCCEIATNRTSNWQSYCEKDQSILPFFIYVACLLDEGVSPIVLQLLQCALCPITSTTSSSIGKPKEEPNEEPSLYLALQLLKQVDKKLFSQFIQTFLLESNSTNHRWAAHSLVYNIYKVIIKYSYQPDLFLDILWSLWSKLPNYGRKAVQFVDLLGYFTIKINCSEDKQKEFVEKSLHVLRQQNQNLIHHPNCNLYNSLQSLVEFDGYYLESEPCLVCNNPEVNYINMKLSSIKVDSRFTTTTQIVKLVGSHTISKITLKISDIKRSKMVKTLNIFYNNRAVHSVVELKNKTAVWHKAKRCHLVTGQSEVKIEFPLAIVACNLMIEYAEFYENLQASSETLQCPRCSASVPANPGVCSNCGENVFQCHKCRAINYDEKDPFLCNSCGFCKYAKFDFTLTAKPTCQVDSIENEDDRKKTVASINSLLDKADRVYKNLIANKPVLEVLLLKIQEHGVLDKFDDPNIITTTTTATTSQNIANAPGASSSVHVNRAIQQVAQRYCSDCKSLFDELSKIIQKVLASRKELVDYDNRQREKSSQNLKPMLQTRRDSKLISSSSSSSFGCYGCASATVEHCITLLKAMAMKSNYKSLLCSHGLLRDLVDYNLKNGSTQVRHEIRQLVCLLTKDNLMATGELNNLLMDKISVALKSRSAASLDLAASVRHEIALLATSMEKEDSCWEQRLRCVMQLFLMGLQIDSPAVLESITLPCLKLLQSLIKPDPVMSKKNKDKPIDQLATVKLDGFQINVDLNKWLAGDQKHCFKSWKIRSSKKLSYEDVKKKSKSETRNYYLMERYASKWREKIQSNKKVSLTLLRSSWLKSILFNGASRSARLMACSLIESLFQIPSRKKEIIDLLTLYLDELGESGEFATEFYEFYMILIQDVHWKYYLALHGLLPKLGALITKEIDYLNHLEETTLNSDLSQGCALKMLVELLTSLLNVEAIGRKYKSKMVSFVLNGYLSLRKLVVQRTKVIDDTQEALLFLLEEMTTGNEAETAKFMSVCLDAVNKCKPDDLRTPVFIFERLCSIIYPEENDTSEFFITLEKDSQQDDFLQGRMLGNPYSSNEPGMGPLMRDIKNKICQDCELVALLEDDSGLELLVNNKIISLDLPVKEVYKKIWAPDGHGQSDGADAMRIIYRIRGLMGDATEEFIESLDSKDSKEIDNEAVYKMANVMSQCGGLEIMLSKMDLISDLSPRARQLMMVLLKLFGHCVKVKSNRQKLIDPSLNSIGVMLKVLKLILKSDSTELITVPAAPGQGSPLEQLAQIIETILVEASSCSLNEFDQFCSATCGSTEDITMLLSLTTSSMLIKSNNNLIQILMRIIPFLTLGNSEKMNILLDFFKPYLMFNKFDFDHNAEDEFYLELFCQLVNGIERNPNGNRLKELIIQESIVQSALEYLVLHAPPMKTSLLATNEEWKEFTSRPALKYVLRILTGLSYGHEPTQMMVAKDTIPFIHGLEQVASESHVGSLAENLLEAIKQNPSVEQMIEQVRRQTKDEKKRMAMAVREKQLAGLGLKTNEKGQVTAKRDLFKQVEDLGEETGLVCIICREGYKFQPNKVLGIYTFTKRCNVDDYEMKSRKTLGYTTVTHFNVVHVDCHMAAVRHARGRDEWESAALQNANTRCNGLLPLWGPQVQESAFASCLARHNTYLQECTGHRDITYSSTIHDLKLLLLKFAEEKSFSDDSGGGGPQSNMHLIPYMIHMALYVINTYKAAPALVKKINGFLESPSNKWIENCFEAESPYFMTLLSLMVIPPNVWLKNRLNHMKRLIICAHVRHKRTASSGSSSSAAASSISTLSTLLTDAKPEEFSVYKSSLIYFAFVNSLYIKMFKNVVYSYDELWPLALAEFIRNNDQQLLESGDKLLSFYEDLIASQSFDEFCDVIDLLEQIPNPKDYLSSALKMD